MKGQSIILTKNDRVEGGEIKKGKIFTFKIFLVNFNNLFGSTELNSSW